MAAGKLAWLSDSPIDDPMLIAIDFDKNLDARISLLKQMQITFVVMNSIHPHTLSEAMELLDRGKCRGVWIRLHANRDLNSKKHKHRSKIISTLIIRTLQKECFLLMDSQAQDDLWNSEAIQHVVNSDLAKRRNFHNTFHRWCTFIQAGDQLTTSTAQRIFSNLGLSSDQCQCGLKNSEHANFRTVESDKV